MKLLVVVAMLLASAPAASAWTRPAVLYRGHDVVMREAVVRSDGGLREAFTDSSIALGFLAPLGDPLVALRPPEEIGDVALAADGSGVAIDDRHDAVIAFDAAGTPQAALAHVGDERTVALAPNGAAVAAWIRKTAQGIEVEAAFRDPGATSFGPPLRAGYATTTHTLVSAGIAESGEAVVAWQVNGFPSDVAAAVRLPGAGFSKARFVTRDADSAELAVGPGGQAILAVTRGAGLDVSIKAPGADAMPAARRIDRGRGHVVDVAAAGLRTVAVAWVAAPTQRQTTRVRVYEGTRRIGTLGRLADVQHVELAVNAAGAMAVAWEEVRLTQDGVSVAYRMPGSRPRAPTELGPGYLGPVRIGPDGHAFALYERNRSIYVTENTR